MRISGINSAYQASLSQNQPNSQSSQSSQAAAQTSASPSASTFSPAVIVSISTAAMSAIGNPQQD
jgi:hypothetical protein